MLKASKSSIHSPSASVDICEHIEYRLAEARAAFLWEHRHLVTPITDWIKLLMRLSYTILGTLLLILAWHAAGIGAQQLGRQHARVVLAHHDPGSLTEACHFGLASVYGVMRHIAQPIAVFFALLGATHSIRLTVRFLKDTRQKQRALLARWDEAATRLRITAEVYGMRSGTMVYVPPHHRKPN